jgi:hypothetical protein
MRADDAAVLSLMLLVAVHPTMLTWAYATFRVCSREMFQ